MKIIRAAAYIKYAKRQLINNCETLSDGVASDNHVFGYVRKMW